MKIFFNSMVFVCLFLFLYVGIHEGAHLAIGGYYDCESRIGLVNLNPAVIHQCPEGTNMDSFVRDQSIVDSVGYQLFAVYALLVCLLLKPTVVKK
jgi:hypothetical protein